MFDPLADHLAHVLLFSHQCI